MSTIDWVLLIVSAVLTSAVSGVLGMAGGVALLGVMTALLPPPWVVPLHGLVQLMSNSTRTVVLFRKVVWRIALAYAIPCAIGVVVATVVFAETKPDLSWMPRAIGIFLIAFLIWRRFSPKVRTAPLWVYPMLGLAVGLLTLVVGATGPLIAPFFLRDDLDQEETIATMAIVQSWGHLLKLPAFLALGFDYTPHVALLAALLGATVIGTLLGRKVLSRVPRRTFELIFQVVLLALAIHLVASAS